MQTIYHQFALLLAVAAIFGAIALRLRQPQLVAFIVVGILLGPSAQGWVTAHDQVDLLAQIGVTVLLFVVGLKLDMHAVRSVGPVALATGIGQIVFTTVIGFGIALALGMAPLTAIYVAVALGHAGPAALGLVTLVGLITITLSTYMILYSQPMYARLAPWLGYFERKRPLREMAMERTRKEADPAEVIIFGAGPVWRRGRRRFSRDLATCGGALGRE